MAHMSLCAFMNAFLLLPVALAVPWNGAAPTPEAGLIAMNGISPRPTDAPGAGKIPRELLKRDQLPFPPLDNWCGLIQGNPDNLLSCSLTTNHCVHSGTAPACCNPPHSLCTYITGCNDATTGCNGACNPQLQYCSERSSFCGSYVFEGVAPVVFYYCDSTSSASYSAEFLNDYYMTAIGSTIDSNNFAEAVSSTESPAIVSTPSTVSTTDTVVSTSPTPRDSKPTNSVPTFPASASTSAPTAAPHKGLAVGAIAGIAVGAACIALAVILGIFLCFCMRKRRARQAAAAQTQRPQGTFDQDPPMQQAHPTTAQNVQYPPSKPDVLNAPPQYPGSPQLSTGYASTYNGQPSPINSPLLAHDPTNRMSNISPPLLPYNHSTPTSINPLSPNPPIMNDVKMNPSAYSKPPISPTTMEAGGMGATMGHAAANEQDRRHEVSGVPTNLQGQNQTQTHGQSQGTVHEVSAMPLNFQGQNQTQTHGQSQGTVHEFSTMPLNFQGQNQTQSQGQSQGQSQDIVHEVSSQSEPRYTAYSPTFSTQQESSYSTYTQSSVQDLSGAQSYTNTQTSTHEPLRGQQSSPGVWELSEQRAAP